MRAMQVPIEQLTDALRWFLRARELRLQQITVSGALFAAMQEAVMAAEHHVDAAGDAFVMLDIPFGDEASGWEVRADELRLEIEERRGEAAAAGRTWPPSTVASGDPGSPLARFAAEVQAAQQVLASQGQSLVLVLAPVWNDDPAAYCRDVEQLLVAPALRAIRFVTMDLDEPHTLPLAAALGHEADGCDARVDEAALDRELAAMIERGANAHPDAVGPAHAGLAWPAGVAPPSRGAVHGVPPDPPTPEARRALQVRAFVLRAATALGRREVALAIELQRQGRDLALELGLVREAVVLEIVLATYVCHTQQFEKGLDVFRAAEARAVAAEAPALAAQALFGAAALRLGLGQKQEAALAYRAAAVHARTAGESILAIEAERMAGTILLELGAAEQARDAWSAAVAIATELPPDEVRATSAAEAARALAALFRKARWTDHAAALDAQAEGWEFRDPPVDQPTATGVS